MNVAHQVHAEANAPVSLRNRAPEPVVGAQKRRYNVSMKTLSLTEARRNLTELARQAIRGEDIGVVCDGKIVALRVVEVYSEDYALLEYGLTQEELDRKAARIQNEIENDRGRKRLRPALPARKPRTHTSGTRR